MIQISMDKCKVTWIAYYYNISLKKYNKAVQAMHKM